MPNETLLLYLYMEKMMNNKNIEKKKKNIIRHCYGLLSLNFFCFLIYQDYHFLTFFILNYILFIIMGWQKYDLNESDD